MNSVLHKHERTIADLSAKLGQAQAKYGTASREAKQLAAAISDERLDLTWEKECLERHYAEQARQVFQMGVAA